MAYELNISSDSRQLALITAKDQYTYAKFDDTTRRIAANLQHQGVQAGDRVAVTVKIHPDFPLLFFALLRSGAVVVPLNPELPARTVADMFRQVECRWLIDLEPSMDSDASLVSSRIDVGKLFDFSALTAPSGIADVLNSTQTATIIFSSGSSGTPHAVLQTVGNHFFNAHGSNTNIKVFPGDRWLISLPFYHVAAIAILFRTFIAGAISVLEEKGVPLMQQIGAMKVTHLSLVHTQLKRILADQKRNSTAAALRAVLIGGSACPPALIRQGIAAGLPLFISYGSTEMASQITTTAPGEAAITPHSSGKVLPYREIKIGAEGEILVRGETLSPGYVKTGEISDIRDAQGWFHTGDTGRIDKADNLTVLGRRDNMFISGGENIYPEEIETALMSLDVVQECCVVDISDAEFGALPVAFLRLRDKGADWSDIQRQLALILPRFKIPKGIMPWPQVQAGLKPDRKKFRELALQYKNNI
ncbi:MAG: o-succinylbenzoate--CoA ligase [Calditrichales bacterium]|nr:MAG: o-succinylbenzoate--CoA ligase [Calditrichales bacterium]